MSKARRCAGGRLAFWCPGCDGAHVVVVEGPNAWGFNGNLDALTLTPSVLVRCNSEPPTRCHSFVTDGRIQFLGDCTHALAGQTVPLGDWPASFCPEGFFSP